MKNLKNLFTYSPNHFFTSPKTVKNLLPYSLNPLFPKKNAFTLAEVLIVIGIIGVVAAITIPNLIADYKYRQYATKYKKFVSTINQAGRMSQEQFGFGYEDIPNDISIYCIVPQYTSNVATQNPETIKSICSLFNGTLTGISYSNIANIKDNYKDRVKDTISGYNPSIYAISLNDGTTFWTDGMDFRTIYVDVDGPNRGPNKLTGCSKYDGWLFDRSEACKVDKKTIGDVFKIKLQKDSYIPVDPVDMYVLHNAK